MNLNKNLFALFLAVVATVSVFSNNAFASPELGGRYRGTTVNTNPESNLPERTRLALVLTPDQEGKLTISGSIRMIPDDAKSELEYIDVKIASAQWNIAANSLTIKTVEHGLTYKLRTLLEEGILKGEVYSDSLAKSAEVVLAKFSK